MYYHISHINYNIGDIIKAGSMGSFIYSNYILNNNSTDNPLLWRLFQEQTFELIRINHYPEKPSRYKSIFLFENKNEAFRFIVALQ